MKTLEKLKKDVLAGGVIDAADVKELENALYKNGFINTEEAASMIPPASTSFFNFSNVFIFNSFYWV